MTYLINSKCIECGACTTYCPIDGTIVKREVELSRPISSGN